MNKLLLLLTLLIIMLPLQAQEKRIFVTKDANGVLIFSDSPQPGAQEVNLTSRPNIMESTGTNLPDRKQVEPEPFKIEIAQPENNGTVRDNTGSVYVSGRITPMFQRGLQVRLVVDGTPLSEPQNKATFILRNIERGEHKLQMELFDQSGKLIATSPVTTFYLHRASVINPN